MGTAPIPLGQMLLHMFVSVLEAGQHADCACWTRSTRRRTLSAQAVTTLKSRLVIGGGPVICAKAALARKSRAIGLANVIEEDMFNVFVMI